MASNAKLGYGASFQIGNGGGPEVFTALAEVYDVGPPNYSRDAIETTHHGSPNGFREFMGGLSDGGEVTIALNYTNASYVILEAKKGAANSNWRVAAPNGAYWQFNGFMTECKGEIPLDDKMATMATFKVSGQPVYVQGA